MSSCNKEFPFPGAQTNVVEKTENPEHLAALEVVEPMGENALHTYLFLVHELNILIFYYFFNIWKNKYNVVPLYMAGFYQLLF